ncbi:MAG: 23S rRNA (uracil(1939)-C(5))-methyltransferase RlmD [Oscillospiraceae bacterium]|nr:23S rRNA (uracil(1939)-C(5))-methyltransferase RlmD [Oscillospiraceae bacterium]
MMQLKKNDIHQLEITGYTADGMGVARLEGRVIFVPRTIRGERWNVQLLKVNKNVAWGRGVELLTPSPARIEPDCPHFGPCGGCQFRHMDYAEELEAKRQQVEDALRRIGGADVTVDTIHGANGTCRYRNKVQFPVAGAADNVRLGLFRSRSHQVLDVTDCLLQSEGANHLGRALKGWMEQNAVAPYDETTGRGFVRHLFVRSNRAGQHLACVVVNSKTLPNEGGLVSALRSAEPGLVGVVLNVNREDTNVVLGDRYRTLWGEDRLEQTLCGKQFRLSVPSFFQINPDQTEVLYGRAVEFAGLTGSETVLDLYCGIGTISLALADHAGKVIGAEIVPEAIEDAKENAARNGVTNAEFFCGDAGEIAKKLANDGVHPDVICVDPPRKGLAPGVTDILADMVPERIVYVSCDPATLARDVKLLAQRGYRLVKAEAVDLFPRTHHVESVALLYRNALLHT